MRDGLRHLLQHPLQARELLLRDTELDAPLLQVCPCCVMLHGKQRCLPRVLVAQLINVCAILRQQLLNPFVGSGLLSS
jgi:hypothetical protein